MNAVVTAFEAALPRTCSLSVLLENLAEFAESREGVARLRELILDLAARGKLVEQDDVEGTGENALLQIVAERNALIKSKQIRNQNIPPRLMSDELPHPIPSRWRWTRLGEIVDYNGRDKVRSEDIDPDAWLLDLKDIEKGSSCLKRRVKFKECPSKSCKTHFLAGDVFYGKLRPYLNKVIVADSDGYSTTEIVPLRLYSGIDAHFLKYLLRRPDFLRYVSRLTYGINLPRLGADDAKAAPIPLPPLPEQRRIIAKVDELLALCDELDTQNEKRVQARSKASRSSLDRLVMSSSPYFPHIGECISAGFSGRAGS